LTATILTIFEIGLFYAIIAPQVDSQMNNNLDGIAEKISKSLSEKIQNNESDNEINEKDFDMNNIKSSKDEQKKGAIIKLLLQSEEKDKLSLFTENILKTTADREINLTSQINGYTVITGAILILFLFYLLYLLWSSIFADQKILLKDKKSELLGKQNKLQSEKYDLQKTSNDHPEYPKTVVDDKNKNYDKKYQEYEKELGKIDNAEKLLGTFFNRFCIMADPTILAFITVAILISFQYSFYLFGQSYKYPGMGKLSERNINILNKYRQLNTDEEKTLLFYENLPIDTNDIKIRYNATSTSTAEKIENIKNNNEKTRNEIMITAKYFADNPEKDINKYIASTGQEELIVEIIDQIHQKPLIMQDIK
jgi:hypothetical protein